MLATDWVTISALATAGGTLVLALATFASVRSANRAARVAERSLLLGLRPLLLPSKLDDVPQKIGFVDEKWFVVDGGRGVAEVGEDAIYLAISVRNVGSGIAVLHGWSFYPTPQLGDAMHRPPEAFARVMSHLPWQVFLILPFETLWTRARAGTLNPGDPVPDFSLLKIDKSERIRLSDLSKTQPVVMIFGSYT